MKRAIAIAMITTGCVEPASQQVVIAAPPPGAPLVVAGDAEPSRSPFRCDAGVPFTALDRAYCAYPAEATWREAERRCAANGGHLATIGSDEENRALQRALGSPIGLDASVWIGLVEPQEGTWTWSTLERVGFADWASGEPNNAGGNENCGELYTASGRWNDVDCASRRGHLCERRPGAGPAGTPFKCTGVAFRAGPIQYCLNADARVDWSGAAEACKAIGASLAIVRSREESEALRAAIGARLGATQAWIGFTDQGHEGRWTWTSGEPASFTRWRSGEPNNAGGREDCAEWILNDAGWNDLPCDERRASICEARR
jgi:hypothetical protein